MKRDDEYLRGMLLEFEAQPDWRIEVFNDLDPTESDDKKLYHVRLLCDAGLMTLVGGPNHAATYRLTNQGHDYLAAIRDEGIWKKTKDVVAQAGGSVTLEILTSVATGFLKSKFIEITGIQL